MHQQVHTRHNKYLLKLFVNKVARLQLLTKKLRGKTDCKLSLTIITIIIIFSEQYVCAKEGNQILGTVKFKQT